MELRLLATVLGRWALVLELQRTRDLAVKVQGPTAKPEQLATTAAAITGTKRSAARVLVAGIVMADAIGRRASVLKVWVAVSTEVVLV